MNDNVVRRLTCSICQDNPAWAGGCGSKCRDLGALGARLAAAENRADLAEHKQRVQCQAAAELCATALATTAVAVRRAEAAEPYRELALAQRAVSRAMSAVMDAASDPAGAFDSPVVVAAERAQAEAMTRYRAAREAVAALKETP